MISQVSAKSVSRIFIEALVVGALLIIFHDITLRVLEMNSFSKKLIENKLVILFIAGFVFHIACEYSGINKWYSVDYCEKISNAL